MSITIRSAGLTLIQDAGRHGHEHVGVPVAGAFDAQRHAQALALLDLPSSAPVFEILGDEFGFTTNDASVMLSIVGPADAFMDYQAAGANHVLSVPPHTHTVIRRNPFGTGPIYVAVLGLEVEQTLGSVAHDTFAKLGPAPVQTGNTYSVVKAPDASLFGRFVLPAKAKASLVELRFVPGPHITDITWPVTCTVNAIARSGVRLSAETDLPQGTGTLASLPVIPGTIQLPPSGEPIILGPDSGVTGGYPVLGVVISADLPLLSRLRPQQRIILKSIDPEEARKAKWPLGVTSISALTQY